MYMVSISLSDIRIQTGTNLPRAILIAYFRDLHVNTYMQGQAHTVQVVNISLESSTHTVGFIAHNDTALRICQLFDDNKGFLINSACS